MAIIFEGTFAELQERMATLPLPSMPPMEKVRLTIDNPTAITSTPTTSQSWEPDEYMRKIEEIIDAADEEEARDAYRIAGY